MLAMFMLFHFFIPSILMWGPTPFASYDGFRFYLVIVDEYSHYIWFFPLARKLDVIQIFSKFLTLMENQFHTRVKIDQIDGGGEFVNHTLKYYFISQGIAYQLSCLGILEQNGFVKRHHRHIVYIALTLMAHSSFPKKFWSTAFQTAFFLKSFADSNS